MRGPNEARRLEHRIFTVPNALSLARLFMVPSVVALLLARADGLAAVVFALAAVTDFVDGRLARRAGPTRLGQILDPVADRLLLSSVAVILAVRGILPAWAVAILVGLEVLYLLLTVDEKFQRRGLDAAHREYVSTASEAERVGKAATAVLMGAIALVVLIPGTVVGQIMFYAGFGLSIVAGLMYLRSVGRVLGGG